VNEGTVTVHTRCGDNVDEKFMELWHKVGKMKKTGVMVFNDATIIIVPK
jgi:hypothetical protein